MNNIAIDISGQQAIFASTPTEYEKLDLICQRYGVDAKVFSKYTRTAALKRALDVRYKIGKGKHARVDASTKDTFSVVEVKINNAGNEYKSTYSIHIDDDWVVVDYGIRRMDFDAMDQIQDHVHRLQGMVPTGKVTGGLGTVAMQNFSAHRLTKGSYFIPRTKLDQWEKFAADIESNTGNKIRAITMHADPSTVSTIMATAAEDLQGRYERALQKLDAIADEPDDKSAAKSSKAKRRKKLLAELDEIRAITTEIEIACGQSGTLSKVISTIDENAKFEAALALLG